MRKGTAAGGSALFLALAPGTFAGLIPWWVTHWRFESPGPYWWALRVLGLAILVAGATFLVHAFARFVMDGLGTPAPVAPTQRLVVSGVYRYVRNPMYLAVTACIVGQGLLFGQLSLLGYAAGFLAITAAFVHAYEEPTLAQQFPDAYQRYRSAVPGWWVRRHPYQPSATQPTETGAEPGTG